MDNRIMGQEYYSADIFEEGFLQIFSSFYRLQYLLGVCRVHVKNRLVTQPSRLQKIYTFFVALMSLAIHLIVIKSISELITGVTLNRAKICLFLINYLAYFFNTIHVRYFNSRKNVMFHVRMQKLDRMLKIGNYKHFNAPLVRSNKIIVIFIFVVFCSTTLLEVVVNGFSTIITTCTRLCNLSFALELFACTSIIMYFISRMHFLNSIIKDYLKQNEHLRIPKILDEFYSSEFSLQISGRESSNRFTTSDIQVYLKEILYCFSMFQDLYRFQLFMFCTKLVLITLTSFQLMLYCFKDNMIGFQDTFTRLAFTLTDFIIAMCLAYRYEAFMGEVKLTKRLCIKVMALHQDGPLWEKAKTTLNIIDETPPRFSVYDLWDINAGMFVAIFSLVTNLIVTMLQFEYM